MKPNVYLFAGITAAIIVSGVVLLAIHRAWNAEGMEVQNQERKDGNKKHYNQEQTPFEQKQNRTITGFNPRPTEI